MAIAELPLLITFNGYIIVILCIAYVATRSTKSLSDYVLGGRQLSGPITALGAGASDMSSWLLMALPGLCYIHGLSMIWMPIALCIGAYCNWLFMAKRLRVYTEIAGNSLTIPEFFTNRFHDKNGLLRVVTSIPIIIFFTYYAAAGFVSGGVLLQHTFTGIDYLPALLISGAVIVIYTAIGGFLAVSWVDFFQGTLMFCALLLVPIVTCLELGGVQMSLQTLLAHKPLHLDITNNVKVLGVLSLFSWGLGYFGQLHINTRFMAIRSIRELPLARRICMTWMVLALLGAVLTGILGCIFYISTPLSNTDTTFLLLSQQLFSPWIAGILLSAVSSAIMSTVSSQILMSASIIAEDFYHGLFRKNASDRENLWVSRIVLVVVASVAIYIAANPNQTIFQAVGFAWSGLGSAFGPTLLFCLYWRRMTKISAIFGILSGAFIVLLWGILQNLGIISHPDLIAGFEMLPGFLGSSLVIVITGLLGKPPSKEILDEFDKTLHAIAQAKEH